MGEGVGGSQGGGEHYRSYTDQGAVQVYVQIREQFRYVFRSENSSGICSDQGTVQVYVQIREQFRFMFRLGYSSGICSDQRTVQINV